MSTWRPLAGGPRRIAPARRRVCFLYIAQSHQVLHSLSAAVELARRCGEVAVDVAATDPDVLDYAHGLVARMGGAPIGWRLLGPDWLRPIAPGGTPPKIPMLAANARRLSAYDAIVTPERTTAVLKSLGLTRTRLVYTQHGAGDRAGPFEPRLGRFDLVFAAGAKQRDRMIAERLVEPGRCAVVGYPKFDLVERLAYPTPRLFAEARPTVLYNPHFDGKLSSWPNFGRQVLEAFAGQRQFNLIFAPHLRLFRSAAPEAISSLAPFLGRPEIHIDLGSTSAAIDMTYARMADIYLGDVSSQVYEFLVEPRPCVFLNAHGAAWRGEESYRHWRFGPVLSGVGDLLCDIELARATHSAYLPEQLESRRYTFDFGVPHPSVRAASAIARLVGCEVYANDLNGEALALGLPEALAS